MTGRQKAGRALFPGAVFTGLLVLLALVGLSACASRLPADRPADFSLELAEDGGMLNRGFAVLVSRELSYIEEWEDGDRSLFIFQADAALLDELYETAREHRVDRIGVRTEEGVYDRGGLNIRLQAAGRRYDKSDSGMSFVRVGWDEEFRRMAEALQRLRREPPGNESRRALAFRADRDDFPLALSIRIGSHTLFSESAIPSAQALPDWISLAPGRYEVIVEYRPGNEPAGGSTIRLERSLHVADEAAPVEIEL